MAISELTESLLESRLDLWDRGVTMPLLFREQDLAGDADTCLEEALPRPRRVRSHGAE